MLKKTIVQGLSLWLVIFITSIATQLWQNEHLVTAPEINPSQVNLVKNASLPIFLSENRAAAIRQLESLIQETNIREIRVYGADQSQIASVVNSKIPANSSETLIDSFPVAFQGSLAGSIQLEITGVTAPETEWGNLFGNSLLTASVVLFLACGFLLFQRFRTHSSTNFSAQPEILEPRQIPSDATAGSSLLLYIFPVVETALEENPEAYNEAIASLYRRLENLVQGYGGRVLSLSNDRFICRMPSGQSSNDNLQALIFAWGIAKPLVFRFENQQYRIEIKALLHKTAVAARQGTLYPAIAETNEELQLAIKNSSSAAHISQSMKNSLDKNIDMEFAPMDGKSGSRFWSIAQVKPSLAMLWRKQEASLSGAGAFTH